MVKSIENGLSVAPFLVKCYEMVDDELTDELISWSQSNNSFIIWDESEFSSELLPKYFKHNKFPSFVRQLNIYGFRKIDTDRFEFANDMFVRGQRHLLQDIVRRKQPQSQVQKKSVQDKDIDPCTSEDEKKRVALFKEVENLKTEKNASMQELVKLRQHQKTSQSKLLLLREQLKGMEKNQQQMLSFIVMAMQCSGFLAEWLQPKESNWRMAESGKNILSPVNDISEPEPVDGAIVRYQRAVTETLDPCATPTFSSENSMEWGLSSDEVRDILMNIDFTPEGLNEKVMPLENHGQLVLPYSDAPDNDDGILEQFLWSSPTSGDEVAHQSEACVHTEMEMDSTFQTKVFQAKVFAEQLGYNENKIKETIGDKSQLQGHEGMNILTEQKGHLNSERKN